MTLIPPGLRKGDVVRLTYNDGPNLVQVCTVTLSATPEGNGSLLYERAEGNSLVVPSLYDTLEVISKAGVVVLLLVPAAIVLAVVLAVVRSEDR